MAKGDVVLITFPFSDLSGSKLWPAVVLASDIRLSTLMRIVWEGFSKHLKLSVD